jgi:putative transposase
MIEGAVEELAPLAGLRPACRALGAAPATIYRRRRPPKRTAAGPREAPARALSGAERSVVITELHSERFADASQAAVWATLLDEGRYLCSQRTMYRLLECRGEAGERRDQLRHPVYARPELLAARPNEVWSWDITKLKGPATWSYYYLYAILDVFSRYIVGWTVQQRESGEIAKDLIGQAIAQQRVARDTLTVHADRGGSMTSKPVAFLLADLGVTKTHNRPYTSTDNPYSEAHFKTLKYRPAFPARFGPIEEARAFCREFFDWYNDEHRHSGIGLMAPAAVHYGRAIELYPNYVAAYRGLADLEARRGRPGIALPLYRTMVKIEHSPYERYKALEQRVEPEYAYAHYALGRAALERRDLAGARAELESALHILKERETTGALMVRALQAARGATGEKAEQEIAALRARILWRLADVWAQSADLVKAESSRAEARRFASDVEWLVEQEPPLVEQPAVRAPKGDKSNDAAGRSGAG